MEVDDAILARAIQESIDQQLESTQAHLSAEEIEIEDVFLASAQSESLFLYEQIIHLRRLREECGIHMEYGVRMTYFLLQEAWEPERIMWAWVCSRANTQGTHYMFSSPLFRFSVSVFLFLSLSSLSLSLSLALSLFFFFSLSSSSPLLSPLTITIEGTLCDIGPAQLPFELRLMILEMILWGQSYIFDVRTSRDLFNKNRLRLTMTTPKTPSAAHWTINRGMHVGDETVFAFHLPPTVTEDSRELGLSFQPTIRWATFQFPSSSKEKGRGGIIRRLRFVTGESELEEAELWYLDEKAFALKDGKDIKMDASSPPPDSHSAWRIARIFWPSRFHADDWQEVSIPAVPASKWWRFIFYLKDPAAKENEPFLRALQFEGIPASH